MGKDLGTRTENGHMCFEFVVDPFVRGDDDHVPSFLGLVNTTKVVSYSYGFEGEITRPSYVFIESNSSCTAAAEG